MASQPQFQLFPSPVSRKKNGNNPFRQQTKKNKRPQSPNSVDLEEVKPSIKTESVLIQIIEDTKYNINQMSQENLVNPSSRATTPEISFTSKEERSASVSSHRNESNVHLTAFNPNSPAADRSGSRQDTPIQHLSPVPSSLPSKSPVVGIKSMFPRYNPNVPLNQQAYYPQNDSNSNSGTLSAAQAEQSNKSCPPAEIDAILGPRTVPPDVVQFPNDTLISSPIQYSDASELEGLWEAANGQKLTGSLGTFNLRLERWVG